MRPISLYISGRTKIATNWTPNYHPALASNYMCIVQKYIHMRYRQYGLGISRTSHAIESPRYIYILQGMIFCCCCCCVLTHNTILLHHLFVQTHARVIESALRGFVKKYMRAVSHRLHWKHIYLGVLDASAANYRS